MTQKEKLKKAKHILFDLDGTLTDPFTGITNSVIYALKFFGITGVAPEELKPFIGPPLKQSFEKFYGFSPKEAEEALVKYREYFSVTGLFENEVYAGIPSLLKKLTESGKKIYIASSKPEVFVKKIIDHFSLTPYITYAGGSLLSGERVEKTDVIHYVLKENNIAGKDAIMVGDRCFDVEGGKKAGLLTVGVLYGYGTAEEIGASAPDAVAETVSHLEQILLGD